MTAFLLIAPVLLFSIVLHEVAHAWQARREGDHTAEQLGRITLNPLKHMDPWGSVLLPFLLWRFTGVAFGMAKPVPVDPRNFRNLKAGDIRVSLAGIVVNLALAVVFTVLMAALLAAGVRTQPILYMLDVGIILNLYLAFFNLLPIPPLDGSHVVYRLLPPRAAEAYHQAGRFGFVVLLALVFFFRGALDALMTPVLVLKGASDWFIRLWI